MVKSDRSKRSSNSSHSNTDSKPRIKYPFRVDYNDHFETPRVAYEHILPLLDAVAPNNNGNNDPVTPTNTSRKKKKRKRQRNEMTMVGSEEIQDSNRNNSLGQRSEHTLYDPYYCNGKMKQIFQEFGFTNVQHEKRDFYKDIKNNDIPFFNTLVTNPPYSENHKEKCMQFAMEHLKNKHKPFFILMPNYVACRNHFRTSITATTTASSSSSTTETTTTQTSTASDPLDILYIVPSKPYEYEHPEGTGKDIPPFTSIWYCGIPIDSVDKVKEAFRATYGEDSVGIGLKARKEGSLASSSSSPRLVSSLSELKQLSAVPTQKRPNPRQRKKAKLVKLMGSIKGNGNVTNNKGKKDGRKRKWNGN